MKRPNDRKIIYIERTEEIDHWCDYFMVPCSYLFEAVDSVGSLAADVYDFLSDRRMLPRGNRTQEAS